MTRVEDRELGTVDYSTPPNVIPVNKVNCGAREGGLG